jgi:hypothetical protein
LFHFAGNPVDSDSIVFPGPTSRPHVFVPEIPKECEEMGVCENIPNYPHEYVNSLISKVTKFIKIQFFLYLK